jgi:hypothetical protein
MKPPNPIPTVASSAITRIRTAIVPAATNLSLPTNGTATIRETSWSRGESDEGAD